MVPTKHITMPTETFELPGVVPYPEDGKEATDHLLPSPL